MFLLDSFKYILLFIIVVLLCFFFIEECCEFGLYIYCFYIYFFFRSGFILCIRVGIIGKVCIRIFKMMFVIGKLYIVVILYCRVISFFY